MRKNIQKIFALTVCVFATACAAHPQEHYSAKYSVSNQGCSWTHITCYSGEPVAENVIYQDNVCRYYFNYGALAVAHSYEAIVQNVVLTRTENCTFQRI
jgi:hypothetical protein